MKSLLLLVALAVGACWNFNALAQGSFAHYEVLTSIRGAEHPYTPAYHELNHRVAQLPNVQEYFYVHERGSFVFTLPAGQDAGIPEARAISRQQFEALRIKELAWKIASRPEHLNKLGQTIPGLNQPTGEQSLTDRIEAYLTIHPEAVQRLRQAVIQYQN
jgi:hypothetical protein